MNYSNTRQLNIKGDFVLNSRSQFAWVEPCAQLALIVLATKLGTCGADSTLGVDYDAVKHADDPIAMMKRQVRAAFVRFEQRGRIRIDDVQAEDAGLGDLRVQLDITDPRRPASERQRVSRTVSL